MNCWLIKSEPEAYSIDDLKRDKKIAWEGVRNYQARNFMRDSMKVGDKVIFYHSSVTPPGAVGEVRVSSLPYPDPSQFDPKSNYFDPKTNKEKPIWYLVDIAFVKKFKRMVSLSEMRTHRELSGMALLQPGSRLSITPVSEKEYKFISTLSLE